MIKYPLLFTIKKIASYPKLLIKSVRGTREKIGKGVMPQTSHRVTNSKYIGVE